MKRFLFPLFLLMVSINLLLASWSVLHEDIDFYADIARDMFLLQEIAEKKFVLIGPRSSVGGLFHGPLWSYLTFPGYVLGNGNPVVVGWYWIFLMVVFLATSYFIAKKLFDKYAAMLFVLMTSLYLAFHANELFNPYGAMFLLPACFFFFIRYLQTKKVKFLIFHLFTVGGLIQFQLAIGVPFLILSFIYALVFALRTRNYKHLLVFLSTPLLIGNFLLFDFKHDFILSKNTLRHLGTFMPNLALWDLIYNRVDHVFNNLEFLRFGPPHGQLLSFLAFSFLLFLQIKNNVHRKIYFVFLYFFVGFFILSLINRYNLLGFYVYPLMSLIFFIFSSFVTGKRKKVFLAVFFAMYSLNIIGVYNYIQSLNRFIGKDQYSWKVIFTAAQVAYQGPEKEFGYFVYSPDILGYGPRYAMEYARSIYKKSGYAFEKKPITYLLIEPPARDNPFTSEEIFKLYKVHIYSTPVMTEEFPSGYKIEKYVLGEDDYLPFDQGINPGLFYR